MQIQDPDPHHWKKRKAKYWLPGTSSLADAGLEEDLVVNKAEAIMELGDGAGEYPLSCLWRGPLGGGPHAHHGRLLLHEGHLLLLLNPTRGGVADSTHT